jgi:hypothetical protein
MVPVELASYPHQILGASGEKADVGEIILPGDYQGRSIDLYGDREQRWEIRHDWILDPFRGT